MSATFVWEVSRDFANFQCHPPGANDGRGRGDTKGRGAFSIFKSLSSFPDFSNPSIPLSRRLLTGTALRRTKRVSTDIQQDCETDPTEGRDDLFPKLSSRART